MGPYTKNNKELLKSIEENRNGIFEKIKLAVVCSGFVCVGGGSGTKGENMVVMINFMY